MICHWPRTDLEKILPCIEHGVIIGRTVMKSDILECYICQWESGEVGRW